MTAGARALAVLLAAALALLAPGVLPGRGGLAAAAAHLPQSEGFLYSRPVEVPTQGWVRVPLDWTTLRHLTPGGLRVFNPAGVELARRVAPYLEDEAVVAPSVTVTSREADCRQASAILTVCRLVLPAPGQVVRHLGIDLAAGAETGYRLYEPRDSRWHLLAEGIWPAGAAQRSLSLPPEPVNGDTLRLELYGATGPGPELKSFSAELAAETVLFEAGEPGLYTLSYGGAAAVAKDLPRHPPPAGGDGAAWLTPGNEEEHQPPALPARAVAPGTPVGETRFGISWKLVAPEARPGTLVRLEVPAAAYGPARPDLGDLRLAAGDRQIPYLRWVPPAPTLVKELAAEPVRSWGRRNQGGTSRIDLDLPQTGLPLTQLLLTAPPMPLRRQLSLRYLDSTRPGEPAGERLAAHELWQCLLHPPLPCRTSLVLTGRAPRLLALRFEDGDNPPLGSLDLSLWRRSDVLLFVWPEKAEKTEIRLLAGARDLQAPDYDLAALGDQLLARPWHPAEVDRGGGAPPVPRWSRWLMPATLGLASLLLLYLLRRALAAA